MRENLPAQRLVSLWAPSHAPCSVSSLHTAHITLLYASLTSLSSSPPSRSIPPGVISSPRSRRHLRCFNSSFFPSSSRHLGLRTIGHVRAFPYLALLPDLVPVPKVDVFPGHRPSSFSLSSFPIHLFLPFSSFLGSSLLRSPALLL